MWAFFIITVSVEIGLALTEWAGMPNVHSAWHDPNKENPFHPKCLEILCQMFLLIFTSLVTLGHLFFSLNFCFPTLCHLLVPFWLLRWSPYISVSQFWSKDNIHQSQLRESARNSVSWAQIMTYQISIYIPRWRVCSLALHVPLSH